MLSVVVLAGSASETVAGLTSASRYPLNLVGYDRRNGRLRHALRAAYPGVVGRKLYRSLHVTAPTLRASRRRQNEAA